ncbi:MAG: hypothetical protein K2Q97_02990 [Burkholderiaceae bacterium]|nr:hypothetical protein [Burkholderiaceae bacterium]
MGSTTKKLQKDDLHTEMCFVGRPKTAATENLAKPPKNTPFAPRSAAMGSFFCRKIVVHNSKNCDYNQPYLKQINLKKSFFSIDCAFGTLLESASFEKS